MQTTNFKRWKVWVVPVFILLMGGVYLVAAWVGGRPGLGVGMAAIMVVVAALLLAGGRSEVVRVLRGQPTDEMWRSFDVRATLFASFVSIVVMVGAVVYEIARGQDGQPYALLCFVGGVSYLAALIWFRWRS
jgi:hypothetical protein